MFLKYLIKALLLPPGLILVGVLAGLLIMRRWRRGGGMVVLLSISVLFLLSLPAVSTSLYQTLLTHEALPPSASLDNSDVIVVLTGGSNPMAPEYGKDIAAATTLVRARYAAFLHKRTGKPILVAGGRPRDTKLSEAETVRQFLEDEMQTPVRWLDEESRDSDDSAVNTMKILSRENLYKIILVTNDYHMRRAAYLFEKIGFQVLPAPIGAQERRSFEIYDFLPSAGALGMSSVALNEWYGISWYALRNFMSPPEAS